MDLDLSGPESSLLERLLKSHRETLPERGGVQEEYELIDRLLRKLTHPMRGGLEQDDSALLSDIGASIAPETTHEERRAQEQPSC